ncbi:GrpB family protein [Spirosoma panaciterrae]|uniref:GrpB family protein n=1 Tax=Spirosoma panaciterrae TaxID=496058 RepID=UPI0003742BAD|nr:GrpB family protein [Spirosoma panaciterrae]
MELITLQKHDSQWDAIFNVEQQELSNVLGHHVAKIHHVGSTAVPDLLAKPIIDIAIEANTFPPSQAIIDQLATIDYEYKGEAGVQGRHWFIKGHPRKFNLHYCSIQSEVVTNQLKLRDKLIANESFRRDYERIKLENLTNKDIDSADYALAKSDIIQKIINSTSLP